MLFTSCRHTKRIKKAVSTLGASEVVRVRVRVRVQVLSTQLGSSTILERHLLRGSRGAGSKHPTTPTSPKKLQSSLKLEDQENY